jgi:hypothetical protein
VLWEAGVVNASRVREMAVSTHERAPSYTLSLSEDDVEGESQQHVLASKDSEQRRFVDHVSWGMTSQLNLQASDIDVLCNISSLRSSRLHDYGGRWADHLLQHRCRFAQIPTLCQPGVGLECQIQQWHFGTQPLMLVARHRRDTRHRAIQMGRIEAGGPSTE